MGLKRKPHITMETTVGWPSRCAIAPHTHTHTREHGVAANSDGMHAMVNKATRIGCSREVVAKGSLKTLLTGSCINRGHGRANPLQQLDLTCQFRKDQSSP